MLDLSSDAGQIIMCIYIIAFIIIVWAIGSIIATSSHTRKTNILLEKLLKLEEDKLLNNELKNYKNNNDNEIDYNFTDVSGNPKD